MQVRFAAVFALVLCLLTASCNTGGGGFDVCSAVSVVQMQQTAVQLAASGMIALSGGLSPDVMLKAKAAYGAWYDLQALIAGSLVAINQSGGNPSQISIQQYVQLLVQTGELAAEIYAIYNSTKAPALKREAPQKLEVTAACSMTDAQIIEELHVKTWAELGGR